MAGTIIVDRIESDSSYASSISIASPLVVEDTFVVPAGSNTAPAITPTGDTNTGIFFPAADTVAFAEGGTEAMRIDSSGNVGIGTSSPDAALTVNTVASFGAGSVSAPSIAAKGDLNTGIYFPAADTIGFACGGTEEFRVDGDGQLWNTVNSEVGTDYTTLYKGYLCRAWVNFNGTSTVAIRASGNVSSITDNSTGNYTVNFTTAMPDADYCVTGTASRAPLAPPRIVAGSTSVPATGSVRIQSGDDAGTAGDCEFVNIAIFR